MYVIYLPDFVPPFYLPSWLDAALSKLGYWLYRVIWHATGETVVIMPEVLFLVLVSIVLAVFVGSIIRDCRFILRTNPD